MFVLVSSLVLFLSISLVSASWFDFFKKDKVEITGNVVSGDKIKIMAIGDSITHCGVHNDCWRYWLWKKLNENGYSNRVDFVGNMQGHWHRLI